jgi:hypothetical protein
MNLTRAAAGAAVLGGLVWGAAALFAWGEDVNPVAAALGAVLFLLTFGAIGYSLVDRAPVWLRAVVCVATPALAYAVWITVEAAFATNHVPVLAAGLALLAGGGLGLARTRSEPVEVPVRGRRAAR